MLCSVCQRSAVCWCRVCNVYFCTDHSGERCFRCSELLVVIEEVADPDTQMSTYTIDKTSRPGGRGYLQSFEKPSIPTIYIDDDGPPECYECGGLAKAICHHCECLFCPDHAGGKEVCRKCIRSSRAGLILLLIVFGGFGGILLLAWLISG